MIFNVQAQKHSQTTINPLNFSDHHHYTKKDIILIKNKLKATKGTTILTTKKDVFKISHYFADFQILILDVKHLIKGEDKILKYIIQKINQFSS